MPLFEVGNDELVPFRRVQAGPELYEREIEELLWQNLDAFIGRSLFPVDRQAQLGGGLVADVVALDIEGRVFVIEVKRDVDRRQLAQCLEYAGWARNTNLDEIAGLYRPGPGAFFAAWTEFTETPTPRLIRRPPQLVLVARDLDGRTDSALAYLVENDLPVTVLRVNLYEDQDHRRFVDVDADHEPETSPAAVQATPTPQARARPTRYEIEGRRIQITDLIDAGLLNPGDCLTWERPRLGATYTATVTDTGALLLSDGRTFSSPSRAAMDAANVPAYDGWDAWRTEDGTRLADLRTQLVAPAPTADTPTNGDAQFADPALRGDDVVR